MRRKEKEITDKALMETILQKAQTCRLALSEDNMPYVVPMNYGYKDGCLYLHSAKQGKKIDILRKNNNVCFEVDIDEEITKSGDVCHWGAKFYSIIGFGKAFILDDYDEKTKGMDIVVRHYDKKPLSDETSYNYPKEVLNKVEIIKIEIEQMTGKNSGY